MKEMHELNIEIEKGIYTLDDVVIVLKTVVYKYADSIRAMATDKGYKIIIHSTYNLDEQDIRAEIIKHLQTKKGKE